MVDRRYDAVHHPCRLSGTRRPRLRGRGAACHRDPGDSFTAATVAFKVIGTAVRAKGCLPLASPFTTELSGPDFAKLLMDGWCPPGSHWASR